MVQQRLGLLQSAPQQGPHRLCHQQPRPSADQLGGQPRHPAVDRRTLGTAQQRVEMPLDQPGGPDLVAGGQGMPDGVVDQPVALVPGRRGLVQPAHPLRPGLPQAGAQQIGEQMVVTPPAALPVQRHQEQVGPFGLLEQPLAVGPGTDGVAERARQPLQHRCLQQDVAQRRRLPVQHLLGQVVEHIPVAAREGGHKAGRVGVSIQREDGELQAGDPSLGAARDGGQAGRRQLQPGGLPQQGGGLLHGEAQVVLAQLGQLTAGPQPGQRQRRVGAAGQHQPQHRRRPIQQQGETGVDRWRLDELVVVQQERDLLGPGDQLVDEGGHDRLQRGRLGPAEQRGDPLANVDPRPVQRRDDIPPEPHRIVVSGIQRQPGDRPPGMARPVAEQARLPEPRRGADQRQLLPPSPRRGVPATGDVEADQDAAVAHRAWWPAGYRARLPARPQRSAS